MERTACRRCGVETLRLRCFDGVVRAFHARISTNADIKEAQRWYASRRHGMISGGEVTRPADVPFMTLHVCRGTRPGFGEAPARESATARVGDAIASRADLPTAGELPLALPGRRWTYRWPSHWAHVVDGDRSHAICGAAVRLPEDMSARERERIAAMRACPRCTSFNARQEHARRPR